MQNITIGRFDGDPEAQGVIKPGDDRWQLVIDKDGYPHLYIATKSKLEDGSTVIGFLALDDMLPENTSIRQLMDDEDLGTPLAPEEEAEAHEAYLRDREARPVPCPR